MKHYDSVLDAPDPMDSAQGHQIYIGNDLYEQNEERSAWRKSLKSRTTAERSATSAAGTRRYNEIRANAWRKR